MYKKLFERNVLKMAAATAFTVVITSVGSYAATFTVTSLADSGAGSLRAAILAANASPNAGNVPDEIQIQTNLAPGSIDLVSPLPQITDAVRVINLGTGNGRIQLNGASTQGQVQLSIGLDLQAPNCATAAPACEIWGFAINRFGEAGIRVGPNSNNVVITQNYIGTDINGLTLNCPDAAHPCGNLNAGVLVEGATGVKVGTDRFTPDAGCGIPSGPACGHSNTIAGNLGNGIVVANGYVGTTLVSGSAVIRNNYIGLAGSSPYADIGNTRDGILIAGTSNNVIGGPNGGADNQSNLIGGNGYNGIEIVPDTGSVNTPANNNTIQGNTIGQTQGSVTARGNDGSGIVVRGGGNTIGGLTAASRNVVVANAVAGIVLSGANATANVIQGNYIGVGTDGTTALGNQVAGIQIAQYASINAIGGGGSAPGSCSGPCNLIANNGGTGAQSARAGIYVDPTAGNGNTIRENSIYNNGVGGTTPSGGGIGIDLGTPGKNANDAGDADTGPNDLQNKPTLSSANTSKFITGTLTSTPNTAFTVDFYLNLSTDVGNQSQGRIWVGSTQASTDGSGAAVFTYTTSVALPQGSNVTATATVGSFANAPTVAGPASTSEFSDPVTVVVAPTAAGVSVAGRVNDAHGVGLRGTIITMTDLNGREYTVQSNTYGDFSFADIPSGQSYVVSVRKKGYSFDSFMLQVTDSVSGLSISANP